MITKNPQDKEVAVIRMREKSAKYSQKEAI
jgi:hypothetical protein